MAGPRPARRHRGRRQAVVAGDGPDGTEARPTSPGLSAPTQRRGPSSGSPIWRCPRTVPAAGTQRSATPWTATSPTSPARRSGGCPGDAWPCRCRTGARNCDEVLPGAAAGHGFGSGEYWSVGGPVRAGDRRRAGGGVRAPSPTRTAPLPGGWRSRRSTPARPTDCGRETRNGRPGDPSRLPSWTANGSRSLSASLRARCTRGHRRHALLGRPGGTHPTARRRPVRPNAGASIRGCRPQAGDAACLVRRVGAAVSRLVRCPAG